MRRASQSVAVGSTSTTERLRHTRLGREAASSLSRCKSCARVKILIYDRNAVLAGASLDAATPHAAQFDLGPQARLLPLYRTEMAKQGTAYWANTITGPSRCSGVTPGGIPVAAVGETLFGQRNICRKLVRVAYHGRSTDVPIVTSCRTCNETEIILSPTAWKELADITITVLQVEWQILDDPASTTSSTSATHTTNVTPVPSSAQQAVEGASRSLGAAVLVPAVVVPILAALAIAFSVFLLHRYRRRPKPPGHQDGEKDASHRTSPLPALSVHSTGAPSQSAISPADPQPPAIGHPKAGNLNASRPSSPPQRHTPDQDEVQALHQAMQTAGLSVRAVLETLQSTADGGGRQAGERDGTRLPAYDP